MVPREVYLVVLEAYVADRLDGAWSVVPARKILENMDICRYTVTT